MSICTLNCFFKPGKCLHGIIARLFALFIFSERSIYLYYTNHSIRFKFTLSIQLPQQLRQKSDSDSKAKLIGFLWYMLTSWAQDLAE